MKTVILSAFIVFITLHQNEARNIPASTDFPKMARYIMHNADWMSIATISTNTNSPGYPFANLKSTSDGPLAESSGVPYMLLTDLEFSAKDAKVDNRVGLMASLAQTGECQKLNLDPQDPRCGRLLITGKLVKVEKSSPEYAFARKALFSRHPVMEQWMAATLRPGHEFYIAKVDIEQIIVMSDYKGSQSVTLNEYLKVSLNEESPSTAAGTA